MAVGALLDAARAAAGLEEEEAARAEEEAEDEVGMGNELYLGSVRLDPIRLSSTVHAPGPPGTPGSPHRSSSTYPLFVP